MSPTVDEKNARPSLTSSASFSFSLSLAFSPSLSRARSHLLSLSRSLDLSRCQLRCAFVLILLLLWYFTSCKGLSPVAKLKTRKKTRLFHPFFPPFLLSFFLSSVLSLRPFLFFFLFYQDKRRRPTMAVVVASPLGDTAKDEADTAEVPRYRAPLIVMLEEGKPRLDAASEVATAEGIPPSRRFPTPMLLETEGPPSFSTVFVFHCPSAVRPLVIVTRFLPKL